jgi:hypothetical protein
MGYFCELANDSTVIRTVVADSAAWCAEHLGGTWVETADPYTDQPQTVAYAGPGMGCDLTFPERFAPPWVPPQVDEDGNWPLSQGGELRFHQGSIWRNLCPAGIPNVWEPPINWRNVPLVGLPEWVQPTSAEDAYALGEDCTHLGVGWRSKIPANTTEPGSDDRWWELIDPLDVEPEPEQPAVLPWAEGVSYVVGNERSYDGLVYECILNHTAWVGAGWTPPASPSLWRLA